MKILFIHDIDRNITLGGAEILVDETKKLLIKKGFEVFSFNFSRNETQDDSFTHTYHENSSMLIRGFSKVIFDINLFNELSRYITNIQPDVIHIHHCHFYPQTILAALPKQTPVVKSIYDYSIVCASGWGINRKSNSNCYCNYSLRSVTNGCVSLWRYILYYLRHKGFVKLSQQIPDIILVPTQDMKAALLKIHVSESKIRVTPFSTVPIQKSKRNTAAKDLLYVGRLTKEKGIHILINAMLLIKQKYPKIVLRIIGSGPEANSLQQLTNEYNLTNNVLFLGKKHPKQLHNYYTNSLALVVPSIWKENFPLVVLEAMSHGLPVIASNIGGLSELVLHNKTGLLVIPNNIRDLEAKILYYKNNQKLFGKYSKYTVNRFNKKLIDSIYIKSIISAYRSVIR